MYREEIKKEYERWMQLVDDPLIKAELEEIKGSDEAINEAFYKELTFGTGGLRGKLGAGPGKMNIYTVTRATLGLAKYLKKHNRNGVAIGYDTRRMSREFAEKCAEILAALGIKSYIYFSALPTPMLSYAVRELKLSAGIMITASHNPAIYNGYKVYGSDGCQITDNDAFEIFGLIKSSDYFEKHEFYPFDTLLTNRKIEYISDDIYLKYLTKVEKCSVLFDDACDKTIKIVYTPLNGTGYKPVTDILKRNGFNNLFVVSEQALPDGNFTTCKKPNPELDEALELGFLLSKKQGADILIATDPDADRLGVAVKEGDGYKRLSGNEIGLLLLEYILSQKKAHNTLPQDALCIKTIVTTPLAEKIAKAYNVGVKNVLTGFKYIGEEITSLEKKNSRDHFILGFEESCGYLGGSYVRDKDGVFAALSIAEMTAFYKAHGISLYGKLKQIYKTYGYSRDKLVSFEFDCADGMSKIQKIMDHFRNEKLPKEFSVIEKKDYSIGIDELPISDVLSFSLENGSTLTVRPSGTEPKIKFYYYVVSDNEISAEENLQLLIKKTEYLVKNIH